MIEQDKFRATLAIAAGWLLGILGMVAAPPNSLSYGQPIPPAVVFAFGIGVLAGKALFCYGCAMLARGKGRSVWWGAFGLLDIFGLIPLLCLTDRVPEGGATPRARGRLHSRR